MKKTWLALLVLLIMAGSFSMEARNKPRKDTKQKKEHRMFRLFKRKHAPSNSMLLPVETKHEELLLLRDRKTIERTLVTGS